VACCQRPLLLSPHNSGDQLIVGKWEIVRRGRGAWHFDKNGKISCVWIAKSDDK